MKEKKYFKLNEDDILEILTEHLALQHGIDEFYARAIIIGKTGEDLRMVAVIGESEDNSIAKDDLNKIDKEIDFNGFHTNMKYINPENFLKMKFDCDK